MIEQIRQMTPGTAVSVGTTPVKVFAPRNRRWEGLIQNSHASTALKIGSQAVLTGGGGVTVAAGEVYRHQGRGELYAVAASGTVSALTVEIIGPSNLRSHTREYTQTITSARSVLLTKNPARLHAVIENTDAVNPVTIGVGRIMAGTGGLILKAGQQIDLFGGMEVWAVTGGTNEVQSLAITGSPTGGTYTLAYGADIVTLNHNSNAAAIQAALETIQPLTGNVTVSGTGPYTITFGGELAARNVPALVASGANLTGGTNPAVAITTSTAGSSLSVTVAVREDARR